MKVSKLLEAIQYIQASCMTDPDVEFLLDGQQEFNSANGCELEPAELKLVLDPFEFVMERGQLEAVPERGESVTFTFTEKP
jgi:hypothetical protein